MLKLNVFGYFANFDLFLSSFMKKWIMRYQISEIACRMRNSNFRVHQKGKNNLYTITPRAGDRTHDP